MIRTDSRKVREGDVFVALPGFLSDGDKYIEQAIRSGASKIVCRQGQYSVETVNTDDPRKYLEEMLEREYGAVISQMTLIAVTGTNGKTTTCHLISQMLNRLGRKCAAIGTVGFYMEEKVMSLPNTSVDICDLYDLLLQAHEKGFDTVALEASSQGLDLGRLNTLSFDAAVFTNLTEDHLDYHKTMENYARAKQKLFGMLKSGGVSVVNADDPYKDLFMTGGKCITYGIDAGDVRAADYQFENSCTKLQYKAFGQEHSITTGMIGKHNIYDALAAITVVSLLGYSFDEIASCGDVMHTPDGRFKVIPCNGNSIIIDYAHTPDAVQKILEAAAEFTTGRIFVVFGCTGDREREKRPVMTKIVLGASNYAIITDDDPHTEPEEQIVSDMLEGNEFSNYEVCLDRKQAIRKGIDLLEKGDSLLILGKGHENFIIMNGYNIPHNDEKEVSEYIRNR